MIFWFQFVTRAVRVIDLITNMDMAAFQGHGGLQAFINRLEVGTIVQMSSAGITPVGAKHTP